MADALEELTRAIGPEARPLVTALSSSLRSGAPLAPGLQRLADAQRRRQRRRAEERIRRLPVLLLAPLVGLVLPAFVVLTIVPVALTTARTGLTPAIGQSAPPPIPTRSPP
jgi:pilus assembly protein TadC